MSGHNEERMFSLYGKTDVCQLLAYFLFKRMRLGEQIRQLGSEPLHLLLKRLTVILHFRNTDISSWSKDEVLLLNVLDGGDCVKSLFGF